MDEQLKAALDFSNYRQTFSVQQKVLKEKVQAKLTFGFNGGIFKINRELISFVQTLLDKGRNSGIVLLDHNEMPILIEDLNKFQDEIMDRYFTSTNEYLEAFQKLKKSRSTEKLIDL